MRAGVVEILEDGQTEGRGRFEFVALPRVGEEMALHTEAGTRMFQVVRVGHVPVNADPQTSAAETAFELEPDALVYVEAGRQNYP
jgi:hypothetical protein